MAKSLQVIVVTPEKAVLDEAADMAILPLFDGEIGVLPGHTAFVGQLAAGELRLKVGAVTKRYFIDGGFAQVRGDVVNVLTPKAALTTDITPAAVAAAQTTADALPATNPAELATRKLAADRAKAMAKVAGR